MASNLIVKDSELSIFAKELLEELNDISDITDSYILCLQNIVAPAYVSEAVESAVNERCGEITKAKIALKESCEPLSNTVKSFIETIAVIDGII